MWPFKDKAYDSAPSPVVPPKDEPKFGDYRIVEMKNGAFFPQIFASMYDDPMKWLTLGRVGESLRWSAWLYPDDIFVQKSVADCERVIREYKEREAYDRMESEAIKKVYPA